MVNRPRVAVWKFASCDGCQLTLLDCESDLLAVAEQIEIVHFLEATSAVQDGPYDVSFVEGSITTAHDAQRIRHVRAVSSTLVTIGACATAGGIQSLRNFADVEEYRSIVYARPDYIDTLATSTPIAAHVPVDLELRGCPIDRSQLLETVTALVAGRRPDVPAHSTCMECKAAGTVCVMVAQGAPCLGPITHAGCGALCPRIGRGCFGCFGPSEAAAPRALTPALEACGLQRVEITRMHRTFNAAHPALADLGDGDEPNGQAR